MSTSLELLLELLPYLLTGTTGYRPGMIPLPLVVLPRLLKLIELTFPAATLLLVNALWLATR